MSTKANLVIDQGTTYEVTLNLTDDNGDALDLAGYTARSQIRKWYTSEFGDDFVTSIDASLGTVTLQMDAISTGELSAGRYVYDVELTDSKTGSISRIVEGIVTVTPQVTR